MPDIPPARAAGSLAPYASIIVLVLLIALFAMIRIRLLELPLERDEGEYAYAGQLILQGIPPYELVYNMKWPGTYAAYAAIMAVFGQTIAGIRIGLLLVTTATALCLYFLAARLFGRTAGVVAAAASMMFSVTLVASGPYGHATHFVALCAAAGYLLLTPREGEALSAARIAGAGALIALAAVMKQPGMFFGVFAALWMLDWTREHAKPLRDVALLAAGAALVLGATAAILAAAGVFARFKFWTIDYARQYVSEVTVGQGMEHFRGTVGLLAKFTSALWLFAIAGLVLLFVEPQTRRHWRPVLAFTLGGLVATAPGLYFRNHYFLTLFPALALLNGVFVAAASRLIERAGGKSLARAIPAAIFAIGFLLVLGRQWDGLMRVDLVSITRSLYGDNPFPESIEVANYLREHTAPTDTIAVIGSEPQIYFYSGRKSATGYIYTYPLMEQQKFAGQMQREMMSEIERAKPKYFVMVNVPTSWLTRTTSDKSIFEWSEKTMNNGQWQLDGIVDIDLYGSKYVWGEEAARYQPKSSSMLMLFKRRT